MQQNIQRCNYDENVEIKNCIICLNVCIYVTINHIFIYSNICENIQLYINNIEIYNVSGPHPSGNVGTLINRIDPVNKGETVWTISAQDLVIIGNMILTGEFNAERIISLSGSSIQNPRYFKAIIGCEIESIIINKGVNENDNNRNRQ